MTIITLEELARGLSIALGGGLAGTLTVSMPGSPLWLIPAAGAVAGCALTVPEIRSELAKALPLLAEARQLLPAPRHARRGAPTALGADAAHDRADLTAAHDGADPNAAGDELFEQLESTPHRLIIGHTRGGKTTLMHHIGTTYAKRGERVLVADPDAAPGLWPGCEVAGHGDDLASIATLLEQVASEVKTRRELRKQGVRSFEPLHLIIDEAQDVIPDIEGARDLFEDIARRGGKLNIRMTVGVQDKLVSTLGLEGKSEILRNLQVADVLKNRQGQRVAVLRDAETGAKTSLVIPPLLDPETLIRPVQAKAQAQDRESARPIEPRPIAHPSVVEPRPAVIEPAQPQPRPASDAPQRISPAHADALLASLLASPAPAVTTAGSSASNTQSDTTTATTGSGNGSGSTATQVTVTGDSSAPIVRIYAQAVATGRTPVRHGRGIDMRSRRARATAQRKGNELRRAYAEARAAGVPSFRQAYKQIGGNSREALAAWQAAAPNTPKLSA